VFGLVRATLQDYFHV